MSAFIHSDRVINALAFDLAVNHKPELLIIGEITPEAVADELYKCNVTSINYLYDEDSPKTYGRYEEPAASISAMQAYKWMRSWMYQSCESAAAMRMLVYQSVKAISAKFEEDWMDSHEGSKPSESAEYKECGWS